MSDEIGKKLHNSFDAQVWAEEFTELFNVYRKEDGEEADEGLMIGWFANALMKGYDERTRVTKRRDCVVLPRDKLFQFMGSLFPQDDTNCAPIAERCVKFVEENDLSEVTFT